MSHFADVWNRRRLLKQSATAAGMFLIPPKRLLPQAYATRNSEREIQISAISEHTLRLSVLPVKNGQASTISADGSLIQASWGNPAVLRGDWHERTLEAGGMRVHATL